MSVNPGFGGQTFIPRSESKVRAVRQLLDAPGSRAPHRNRRRDRPSNAARVVAAGAEILVAGPGNLRSAGPGARDARPASGRAASGPPSASRSEPSLLDVDGPRALRGNRQDGGRLLRQLFRLVRGRRAPICCGRSGGAIARWNRRASSLPVIEAQCEYLRPARYDDELEVKTDGTRCCRRSEWSSPTKCASRRRRRASPRPARPCTPRSTDRPALQAAGADPRGVRMKALVTGAAGFIGSHLTAALLDAGAR